MLESHPNLFDKFAKPWNFLEVCNSFRTRLSQQNTKTVRRVFKWYYKRLRIQIWKKWTKFFYANYLLQLWKINVIEEVFWKHSFNLANIFDSFQTGATKTRNYFLRGVSWNSNVWWNQRTCTQSHWKQEQNDVWKRRKLPTLSQFFDNAIN